ncbi:MAG: hypothetical protein ABI353_04700 [Isosphaeraceae bacterium]
MSERKKQDKPPTAEDLAKAALLDRLRPLADVLEPPIPFALAAQVARLDGVTRRTRDFLESMPLIDKHWKQNLYLAATDLHGNGHYVEEVLGLLISGAKAWGDPERLDAALNCIARAYSKPAIPHREIMRQRELANTRNKP